MCTAMKGNLNNVLYRLATMAWLHFLSTLSFQRMSIVYKFQYTEFQIKREETCYQLSVDFSQLTPQSV